MQGRQLFALQAVDFPRAAHGHLPQAADAPGLGRLSRYDGQGHALRLRKPRLHSLTQLVLPRLHPRRIRPGRKPLATHPAEEFLHRQGMHHAVHGREAGHVLIAAIVKQQHRRAQRQAGHGAVQAAGDDEARPRVYPDQRPGGLHAALEISVRGRVVVGQLPHLQPRGKLPHRRHSLRRNVHAAGVGRLRLSVRLGAAQRQCYAARQLAGDARLLHQAAGALIPAIDGRAAAQIRKPRTVQLAEGNPPHILRGGMDSHADRGNPPVRQPVGRFLQYAAAQKRRHPVILSQV